MPERVQLSRRKGWRMPPDTVKVDRSTKWGNPFPVTAKIDRADAVERFRTLCNSFDEPTWQLHIHELRGKNLACWCPLTDKDGNPVPCHADVLLELANSD